MKKKQIVTAVALATGLAGAAGAAIDIGGGRQLFVDDFLIAATNGVVRHWNAPVKAEAPVVNPESMSVENAPVKVEGFGETTVSLPALGTKIVEL